MAFLNKEWKKEKYMPYFEGRQILFTCGEVCSCSNGFRWENVNELVSNKEEADTRLLLYSHHASRNGFDDTMIFFLLILFYFSFTIAPKLQNTDLFLLMLLLSNEIAGKLYMKNGTRGKTRMNDIADVNDQLD